MFQQGLTDTLSATEIRQSIDQTQERTKRSTAGSSAHGFSCSRRLSPLSGRNSTYDPVQISGTGSFAKETTNPRLAAVLIEKAADLKSQVDESSTTPDPTAQAPDVDPETSPPATGSP